MKRTGFARRTGDLKKFTTYPQYAIKAHSKIRLMATTPQIQKKRSRKTPLRKAKEILWQLCREITFKRHGNTCYTCAADNLSGSNRHCGHFITKSTCSAEMAYALENLRPQCYSCNINKSGNWVAYEAHLLADGINPQLLKERNQATIGKKYDVFWYNRKIIEYTLILESL